MSSTSLASSSAPPVSPRDPAWERWLGGRPALAIWLPVLVALLAGLAFQGTRGLHETSETRYAEVAREMVVTGNWLEPTLDFEPHWTKPPFTYWTIAASVQALGTDPWAVRLPGALALAIAAAAVGWAGRVFGGPAVGAAAGVLLAAGWLPVAGAHTVTTDIWLLASVAVAAAAFASALAATDPAARFRWKMAAAAALGWAFLVKGPPALLALLAWAVWSRLQPASRKVRLTHPVALGLLLLIGGWWFILMMARHPSLLGYYLGHEVVNRVASDEVHNSEWYQALPVYGPTIVLALGLPGVWAFWLALRRGGWFRAERWRELWRERDARLWALLWWLLPLAVFCVVKSKLHLYVLPLAAPLALLAGRALVRHARLTTAVAVTAASLALGLAAKGAYAHQVVRRDMTALAAQVRTELAALPPGADVVVWDEPRNHGLTFHLERGPDERVIRVDAGDRLEKFERMKADEFRAAANGGGFPRGAVVVVSARKRETFAAQVGPLSAAAARPGRHWDLLRLPPSSP